MNLPDQWTTPEPEKQLYKDHIQMKLPDKWTMPDKQTTPDERPYKVTIALRDCDLHYREADGQKPKSKA